MTDPARCACGEPAPIRLIRWYHGVDADMCPACWRKHELLAVGGWPVEAVSRGDLLRLFDEEKHLSSPHREGCRLCPVTPCG